MKIIRTMFIILLLTGRLLAQIPDKYYEKIDEEFFITNETEILRTIKPEHYFIKESAGRSALSYAEILYGVFENFKANLTIARETGNSGWRISYIREKLNSYNIENKKIYNSAMGMDSLETSITYSFPDEIILNLTLGYNYFSRGMMSNSFYDIQNKRYLLFLPEFKYLFSEDSIFSCNFNYTEISTEFESSSNSAPVNINSLKTVLSYERIWSEINALSFNFTIFQYTLKYSDNRIINNVGTLTIKDKFAISRKTIIDIQAELNLNKKYEPVFSPLLKLNFILKPVSIFIELNREYNAEKFSELIFRDYFVKLIKHNPPQIDTGYSLGLNFEPIKNLNYEVKAGYHNIENIAVFYESSDSLFYVENLDIKEIKISHNLNFIISDIISFNISHTFIPYIKDDSVPYLAKNSADAFVDMKYSNLNFRTILQYNDTRKYRDQDNTWRTLKSFIAINFEVLYLMTENFGVKLSCENIANNRILKLANYPEPEEIYRLGLYTKF